MEPDKKVSTRNPNREEMAVITIYACISAYIAGDQLLSPFILSTIVRVFELLCLALIAWNYYILLRLHSVHKYRGWALVLLIFLAINNLLIIVRGDYSGGIKDLVLDKFAYDAIPAYVLPFIVLFLPNRKYFKLILQVLFFSMLFILPIWLINALDLVQEEYYAEAIGAYLPFYGIILLQFRRRFSIRQQAEMIGIYLVYLLLMILNARRNMVVSLTLYFVLGIMISCYTLMRRSMRIRIIMLGGAFFVILLVFLNWDTLSTTVFSRILYRGFEDSRSGVELLMITDFASSPASDWVIGRGLDGTYAQMTENKDTYEILADRGVIETGYLYLILKGGALYVLCTLLFLFTAFFRGISFKKIHLTGLSIVLLVYLLDLYMTNPVSYFSVRTVVFWLIVSVCLQYSKPNERIKNENSPCM